MLEDGRKTNGGSREGAGRPRKFKNPALINFRIEEEDKIALKEAFGKGLNVRFIDWVRELLKEKK